MHEKQLNYMQAIRRLCKHWAVTVQALGSNCAWALLDQTGEVIYLATSTTAGWSAPDSSMTFLYSR